jgi:hypothetical protein
MLTIEIQNQLFLKVHLVTALAVENVQTARVLRLFLDPGLTQTRQSSVLKLREDRWQRD